MTHLEEDHYVQSAEMYDMLAESHWSSRRASVVAFLESVGPKAQVVVDVGAGTGHCVMLAAEVLPDARIHAIEPSPSMRVGLMTKILADPDLRRRVDVYPASFQNAPLPQDADIVLICGCVGYLDKDERQEMFRRVAACLSPQGVVLIDVMPLEQPQVVPQTKLPSVAVGSHTFDISLSGNPVEGTDITRWSMRFEQTASGVVIRSFEIDRDWHTFSLASLLEEAKAAGFRHQMLDGSPVPAALLTL